MKSIKQKSLVILLIIWNLILTFIIVNQQLSFKRFFCDLQIAFQAERRFVYPIISEISDPFEKVFYPNGEEVVNPIMKKSCKQLNFFLPF